MKTILEVGSNIGQNAHRIFPTSGTPDVAQKPDTRFRINGATHSIPAIDYFNNLDVLLFEDGSTLIYDDVDRFVTHGEWARANSSSKSAEDFFTSFKQSAA